FFFQAEDGIRDRNVTGVQTCALPICYEFTWLSAAEIGGNLAEHLGERTRIVWLETPTNPLLNVIDIRAAADAAHAAGAMVVVDRSEERRVGKECRSR